MKRRGSTVLFPARLSINSATMIQTNMPLLHSLQDSMNLCSAQSAMKGGAIFTLAAQPTYKRRLGTLEAKRHAVGVIQRPQDQERVWKNVQRSA